MLTYVMQDEYMARAVYDNTMAAFGVQRPFSSIIGAEDYHITMLTSLFEKYGITIPTDNAKNLAPTPGSVADALATGVQAEKDNICYVRNFPPRKIPLLM